MEESRTKTKICALLWDVGGPLVDEEAMTAQWLRAVGAAYREVTGEDAGQDRLRRAMDAAIASFAPFAFRSAIWHLCEGDEGLYRRMMKAFGEHIGPYSKELRPGMRGLLAHLADRVPMGIVANQGRGLEERLEKMEIRHCFRTVNGSDDVHLWKPDTRLFERALACLGARAASTAMIGDRQDNDIAPAKAMGMTAILFVTGTHADQRFRYPEEQPDRVVRSVDELRQVLDSLIQ